MPKEVVKRDGSKEEYQEAKIERVVIAAGLAPDQGKALAEKVTVWINSQNNSDISTMDIRNIVTEELKKIDINAYNLYVWYENTKDGNSQQ